MAAAEADLAERERAALAEAAGPAELAALADERDKLSDERDQLADDRDQQAEERNHRADARDVRASARAASVRGRAADRDTASGDRYLEGVDSDEAAGDRAAAREDREAAARDRAHAATDRARAAHDRDRAREHADEFDREIAGLREALRTRNLIGQAQGVLIERYGTDADAAFRMLVRLSQQTHMKLRDVAHRLVEVTIAEKHANGSPPAADV